MARPTEYEFELIEKIRSTQRALQPLMEESENHSKDCPWKENRKCNCGARARWEKLNQIDRQLILE